MSNAQVVFYRQPEIGPDILIPDGFVCVDVYAIKVFRKDRTNRFGYRLKRVHFANRET